MTVPEPPPPSLLGDGFSVLGRARIGGVLLVASLLVACPAEPPPPQEDQDLGDDDDSSDDPGDDPSPVPPVAVCWPAREAEVGGWFWVAMSESFHPAGLPLTYSWTVETPSGEVALPTRSQGVEAEFQARMPGSYLAVGVAEATDGGVASCEVEVVASVRRRLFVTARWEIGGDVDLHFARAGGAWRSDDDCYHANCNTPPHSLYALDWGEPGNLLDNPQYGGDWFDAPGIETVGIVDPSYAPADSPYAVGIRFPFGYQSPIAQGPVAVGVWIDGAPAAELEVSVPPESDFVCPVTIDWSTGLVSLGPEGCPSSQ